MANADTSIVTVIPDVKVNELVEYIKTCPTIAKVWNEIELKFGNNIKISIVTQEKISFKSQAYWNQASINNKIIKDPVKPTNNTSDSQRPSPSIFSSY